MAATAPDLAFSLKAGQRGANAPLMALSLHQKETFFQEHLHSTPTPADPSDSSLDHVTREAGIISDLPQPLEWEANE